MLLLAACTPPKQRIASAPPGTPHYQVAQALTDLWGDNLGYRWAIDTVGEGSVDNLTQLIRGEVEFALAQNDATVRGAANDPSVKLRSVLPLYEQVFFLIYKPELEAATLQELIRGRKVCVGPASGGTAYLTRALFQSLGMDTTQFEFQYTTYQENRLSDSVDISVSVTTTYNSRIQEMIANGGKVWSLDSSRELGYGCTAEAFCQIYPMARPYVIPRFRYPNLAEPVLSVAVDNVLLTRAETDPTLVYDMVKTILEHRRELGEINPLFLGLKDQVAAERLHYPLHPGTEDYLRRHEPSILTRNAELISLLITLGSVAYGVILFVARQRRERVRSRIENHYEKILAIEEGIPNLLTADDCAHALQALHNIRLEATRELTTKKLDANIGFRILLDLLDQAQEGIFAHRRLLATS